MKRKVHGSSRPKKDAAADGGSVKMRATMNLAIPGSMTRWHNHFSVPIIWAIISCVVKFTFFRLFPGFTNDVLKCLSI